MRSSIAACQRRARFKTLPRLADDEAAPRESIGDYVGGGEGRGMAQAASSRRYDAYLREELQVFAVSFAFICNRGQNTRDVPLGHGSTH